MTYILAIEAVALLYELLPLCWTYGQSGLHLHPWHQDHAPVEHVFV